MLHEAAAAPAAPGAPATAAPSREALQRRRRGPDPAPRLSTCHRRSSGAAPMAPWSGRRRKGAPLRWNVMPTYLADIIAAHRARRRGRSTAPCRTWSPRRPSIRRRGTSWGAGRGRPGLHRRDQAPIPVQGRSGPRSPARPRGQGLRQRWRRLHLGPDRRRLLRRLRRRPRGGPRGGRVSRSCARTSPCRRPTWPMPGSWGPTPSCSIAAALSDAELTACAAVADELGLAALVEVHDEEELARALGAGAAPGRGQPARPADLPGGPRAGLRHGRRAYRPAWWPWPSRASATPTTPAGWPTRATTPSSSARRSCGPPTARPQLREPHRASGRGRDERRPLRQDLRHHLGGRCAARRVSLGADAVGFIFAPSPRQVSVQTGRRHRQAPAPRTCSPSASSATRRPSAWSRRSHQAGLGAAQLHGHESAEETQWVRARVRTVIKAFPAGDPHHQPASRTSAPTSSSSTGRTPGSGEVFDWRLAEGVADPHRLIVSGGLRPDNVAQAVAHLRPAGVDVATGVESSPGRKDPMLLREFIINARRGRRRAATARDPLERRREPRSPTTGGTA